MAVSLLGQHAPQAEREAPPGTFLKNDSQHLSVKLPLISVLSRFYASVNKMCPKIIASSLNVVPAYKKAHRYPLLSARKPVILRSKIEVRRLALGT